MNTGTVIALGIGFLIIINMGKNLFNSAVSFVQDTAADTLVGGFLGLRTTEASKAADWIKKRLWLRNDYADWLLRHLKVTDYNLNILGQAQVEHIANEIIQAKTTIFNQETIDNLVQWGISIVPSPNGVSDIAEDHPQDVVDAIAQIQNQVHAMQVAEAYYLRTKKNLSIGLQWLPNEQMLAIYGHLAPLPTGIAKKPNNPITHPLTSLPKPPNIKV